MTISSVVPVEGTSGQFAAMKVLDFTLECGAAETEIILKTRSRRSGHSWRTWSRREEQVSRSCKSPQSAAAAVTESLREVCNASKD